MRSTLSKVVGRWMHTSVGRAPRAPSTGGLDVPHVAGGTPTKKRGLLWWTAIGFGAGATVGAALGYNQLKKMRTTVPNTEEQNPVVLATRPAVPASRSVCIFCILYSFQWKI